MQDEEPTRSLRDESPPTVVLDPPRNTNPVSWAQPPPQQSYPPTQWQSAQPQQNYAFAPHPMMMRSSPTQTLAVLSIASGAAAITIGWCCSMGLLFSPAAIIMGFISLAQIKRDPMNNSGKGLAIAGIGLGALYLVLWIFFIIIWGIANLLPAFLQH
jgi:Domain of unknown function (DUF4190)